jgi:hypothetical protein
MVAGEPYDPSDPELVAGPTGAPGGRGGPGAVAPGGLSHPAAYL